MLKDWKTSTYKLFDLSTDIGAQKDLSISVPEKYQEMVTQMNQWLKEVDAQLPTPDLDYKPGAESQQHRRNSRKLNSSPGSSWTEFNRPFSDISEFHGEESVTVKLSAGLTE